MYTSRSGKTARSTTVWVNKKQGGGAQAAKMKKLQKDLMRLINKAGLKKKPKNK